MENKEATNKVKQVSHIYLQGEGEPVGVRVVLEGREGPKVFVRRLGTGEADTGETVPFIPGEEELILTERIEGVGINLTPEVGRKDDLLTWLRLVPDGREGSTVYGRTLRRGEIDTGEAVNLRPGDTLTIRPGALVLALEAIDEQMGVSFEDGYKTITNTIWTWLTLFGDKPEEDVRFLIATARRLDASHRMLRLIRANLSELGKTEAAIPKRNLIYEVIGIVEMAVVTMNRALDMTSQLGAQLGVSTPLPVRIAGKLPVLREIRNAYEHIEDRARGLVRGKPHPDALSIFNFERLFKEHVVAYGSSELNLESEATDLLVDARHYLRAVLAS